MATSPEKKENLMVQIKALNELTAKTGENFEALAESIQIAKDDKTKAKADYSEALDLGDADGMQKALDRIKATNEQIKSLGDQMKSYGPKVMELRKVQASLIDQARQESKTAEEAVKKAKRQFVDAESVVNAATASAGFISGLDLAVNQATAKKSLT